MNIAYASDNNFVDVMCVSIMSFNDHNSDANIYILDCGIEEYNKQKILELCSGKNTVLFVDAKKVLDELDYDLNLDRGSVAAYARLFIGSVLPDEVTRVLYLDCDTLVRVGLKELYEFNLCDNIAGGVRDAFSYLNKMVFGIEKNGLFINSGMMLINVSLYRERNVEKNIYELIKRNVRVYQGDQGIVNTVLKGCMAEVPLRYNLLTYLFDFNYDEMMAYRRPDNYFDKEAVDEAIRNPGIIHFSTCFLTDRPWNACNGLDHPYYKEWKRYYDFAGGKTMPGKKRAVIKKNKVILALIGLVHAYIRPLKYLL